MNESDLYGDVPDTSAWQERDSSPADVSQASNVPDSGNLITGEPCSSLAGFTFVSTHPLEALAIGGDDGPQHVDSYVFGDTDATIPLWEQALWLARNIEEIHSPRPEVISDDELRGLTLIRVLTIGADEHGDAVFRECHEELVRERKEEWSDAEFYDLVDRLGWQIRGAE